jgi:hypothetical protein
MALAVLVAGVNYNAQAVYLRPFDNGALADWSMNGGQNRNNEFLLDGAPNNANQGGNNIAYVPPADSVQEFKVSTNSYDAQYGRTAGGVVNVSLKSGTNSFHGSVSEYYRRKWLDSNSFLLNSRPLAAGLTNAPKIDHYLDQYGFSVDGPVRIPGVYDGRNKTFFLFTGEKYREGTPNPLFSTVPTPAMKNGDFSGLVDAQGRPIIIYDPATGRDVNGVWTRDPFPGNQIPASRISPAARALLQYYPDPNNTTAGVAPWQQNLAFAEHFNKDVFWNWVGKVDHNFSSKDRVFFRWGENQRNEIRNTSAIRTGPAQDGQLPLIRSNRALVADWVHIFGAAVFNIRGGYTYYLEGSRSDAGLGFDATSFGWPSSVVSQFPAARLGGLFPRIDTEQFVSLSRGLGPRTNKNFSLQPNVSLNRGKHNIRTGLDLRRTNVYNNNYGNAGGTISFNRGFTRSTLNSTSELEGNAFASLLLGAPSGGDVPVNLFPHFLWTFAAPWVQDDWRLTDKFTVNAGFRWDFNSPVSEAEQRQSYIFDTNLANPVSARVGQPVKGGLTFVNQNGAPKSPWQYDKNNYQLRIGGAYQLNQKTVLRGGYGKYFLNPTGEGFLNGYSLATSLISSNDGGRTPTYALGNPFPNGVQTPPGSSLGALTFLGRNPSFSNPDFVVPNVHQFSLGFQRELPWHMSLEATYVGSRSNDVQSSWAGINEPSLEFLNKCDVTKGGNRSFCDELLPNPFFGVAGFQGTTRYTSPTLSRFELSRPFPAFTGLSSTGDRANAINMTERNDGKMWYDSAQFVVNKRWGKGLTLNGNYTWVPRWTEEGANTTTNIGNGFIDDVTMVKNRGPYFSHRKHRFTVSGVWELPWRDRKDLIGRLAGGWSLAPMVVYQSGQPWDMPTNVELIVDPKIAALSGKKEGQFMYGVKPCVADRASNGTYQLLSVSTAYGCTEPYFLVRQAFQRRNTMLRYDEFRRPTYWDLTMGLSKTTTITDRVRMQVRLEAFNLFNSPMYDERNYNQTTSSGDFGRINRNTTAQSNFQRAFQLGFKLTY